MAAVVQEACVHGGSTRQVDDLVKALGMGGVSKSRVSELCEELDGEVEEDVLSYAAFPVEHRQKGYFSAGSLAKLERKEEAVLEQPELMAG